MMWTWEHEKSLGLAHLDRMAEINRKYERLWQENADRDLAYAAKYRDEAERFEEAAREVRGEALPPFMPALICGVATGSGLPCSRVVTAEGERCWQHPEDGR